MTAFSITDASYAKGMKIVRVSDSHDGMKGRCALLAEALGGRWVHRSRGYCMRPAAVEKFKLLFEAGFHGHLRVVKGQTAQFHHPERNLQNLKLSDALKLTKGTAIKRLCTVYDPRDRQYICAFDGQSITWSDVSDKAYGFPTKAEAQKALRLCGFMPTNMVFASREVRQ